MKQLNFTCKEKLQFLLKKECTQTIRKAWEDHCSKKGKCSNKNVRRKGIIYQHKCKPPKFKIGDEAELFWNKDSEFKWFCKLCGKPVEKTKGYFICRSKHLRRRGTEEINSHFLKNLGKIKITEVFEIEMSKDKIISYELNSNVPILLDRSVRDDFAKLDGFKSAKNMFAYFDKNYNLSSPKKFHVYRWVNIK